MSAHRLPDYIDHIQQAATDACGFTEDVDGADTRHTVVIGPTRQGMSAP